MQKNDTCFNFALTEHIKQDKPGKVFGNVRLYKYPVRELCVYETLDYYLQATENSGILQNCLFRTLSPKRQ